MSKKPTANVDLIERQQLTHTLNRTKLVTLALEFGSTLQHFPKLRQELDAFLAAEDQAIDYIELASNIRPKLEQAAELLFCMEQLPAELAHNLEIKQFTAHTKANLVLHAVATSQTQWLNLVDSARQKASQKQAQWHKLSRSAPLLAGIGLAAASLAIGSHFWPNLQKQLKDNFHRPSNSLEPEMVSIPAGSFMMGCVEQRDKTENMASCNDNELPAHEVAVTGFKLGKYEVTFAQWDACEQEKVCPHIEVPGNERNNYPVVNISWDDAQTYINWLNKKTGKQYRLPTEAEWEYAARSGSDQAYPWGMAIDTSQANFGHSSQASEVGRYPENDFGLYDMHGNVWEWCQDSWHDNYAPSSASATNTTDHVMRGGSWMDEPNDTRSATRLGNSSDYRDNYSGFRLAISE